MKRVLTSIVISVAVLLAISSCATVPTGPLEEGELRLLSLEVPEHGNLQSGVEYRININFKADGKPEIRRVCMTYSGDGPYCAAVKKVIYGSEAYIQIPFYTRMGEYRLECYVEYVRDGKTRRTNTLMSFANGVMPW